MTEASVTYIKPNRTDAGAIPVNTQIATHSRTSDGASVQDVYIDPDSLPDDGVISAGNTTEVNLAGGATFEGTFENCLQYGAIRVAIYSSHASASRGLQFWCSKDGTDGFIDDSYTVPAATPKTYAVPVSAPYFKVRYTNGATQTTTLKICTIFQRNVSVVSSHRLGDTVTDDDDAQLINAVLKAKLPNNTYANIDATAGGNLKVSIEEVDSGAYPFITTRADDFYNDAFQRLRVSDTDQRFDGEFIYDKSPLLFDDISAGGGTTTHNGNSRDVTIATGATGTGVSAGLRQHFANPYTPGNSQFIAITGVTNGANIAGGRAEVFLRSKVTGTAVEEVIPQADWVAKSTGVNWNDSQIFLMDFQSLKVGRIRFGLDVGGVAIPVTEITNDNEREYGYWQLASQPVYWRQYNTADYTYTEIGYGDEDNAIGFRYRVAVNSTQTMRAICATVKSEGGGDLHDIAGLKFSASNGLTKRTVSTTYVPVLSIQLKATFNTYATKGIVFPEEFELTTDNAIYYEVRVNPTLTGAAFASVSANSIMNRDVTATAVTGGRVIKAGYAAPPAKAATAAKGILDKVPLSVSALGVGDILSLCVIRDTTTNASVGGVINWNEIR